MPSIEKLVLALNGLGFGFHGIGEPMTLTEFRAVFKRPLIGNCGYTIEDAEKDIQQGHAEMIAIGRPYISNPDLVERIRNDWPLAAPAEMSTWYSPTGAIGYTGFPTYPA